MPIGISMKVIHFLGSFNPIYGGPTYSVKSQCLGLANRGVNVSLATESESKRYLMPLIEAGVKVVDSPTETPNIFQSLYLRFSRFLKGIDEYDIYHCHGVWRLTCHWVSRLAFNQGAKYVVNPRGDLEMSRINYNKWKKLKKTLAWYLYAKKDVQNASCLIATSKQEAQSIRRMGVATPIAIIPNGMDLTEFQSVTRTNANKEKKTVLFLSRVNPIKGLELLLEAWALLPSELLDGWELHIVGNSDPVDYKTVIAGLISRKKISSSVKMFDAMVGYEKINKYLSSDLFILPSFSENFGNVVAEAMLCECPVITTTNTPWDCLVSESCGWWIDLSIENLVRTLSEAMSLTDMQRSEMGKRAKCFVENTFSIESVSAQTEKLYTWIMNEGEKPEFVV